MKSNDQIIFKVANAVNDAINLEDYSFDFFSFLESEKVTKKSVKDFMKSSIFVAITDQSKEIDLYINDNQYVKTYDWIGKKRASEIKNYLDSIMEDAKRYERIRQRKSKQTTNK